MVDPEIPDCMKKRFGTDMTDAERDTLNRLDVARGDGEEIVKEGKEQKTHRDSDLRCGIKFYRNHRKTNTDDRNRR